MSTATMARPTEVCRHCDMPVLIGKRGSSRVALDPTPQAGGLYVIGAHDHLARRHLTDLADENRAGSAVHGGGYVEHECPTAVVDDSDDGLAWFQR